jgi:hypothetical protein
MLLALLLLQVSDGLITNEQGELPVIISAPHGGTMEIPGVPARTGLGEKHFTTVRDTDTDLLAKDISRRLEKQLGAKPYLVVAHFSRRYLDANRPASEAYESEAAKPVYGAYELALSDDQKAILKKWGCGILVDIHGQGRKPDIVYRGTDNLMSVKHWLSKFGESTLTGATGVLGLLDVSGIHLFPSTDSKEKELSSLDGGYTVQHFGSANGGSFDAIQLEFGRDYRTREGRPKTAEAVAEALAPFIRKQLLPSK